MDNSSRCIATSSDSVYFPALIALLRSLEKTNPDLDIVVFDGGLTRRQARKAAKFAEIIPKKPFTSLPGRGKFSYIGDSTLLKFEVAELQYDKVLYLDADMIVTRDLRELFDFPEGTVGVVMEVNKMKSIFRVKDREMLISSMDAGWEEPVFNAGLFSLRPGEWPDLKDRASALIGRFGGDVFSKTKDQQLLNLIFRKKIHQFHPMYNFSPLYDEGKCDPAIIHYLSRTKPWHTGYPLKARYREFRANITARDHFPIVLQDLTRAAKSIALKTVRRAG